MSFLRQRLPRFAALVLLVWLFASGVAFAHSCQATLDLECIECCEEMKAPTTFSAARADAVVTAAPATPLPPAADPVAVAWAPAAPSPLPATDPPPLAGTSIPIAFLRLAL